MISLPTRVITFKADIDLIEKIDKLAKMLGSTRSDIIRMAVIYYIRNIENEELKKIIEIKPLAYKVKSPRHYLLRK